MSEGCSRFRQHNTVRERIPHIDNTLSKGMTMFWKKQRMIQIYLMTQLKFPQFTNAYDIRYSSWAAAPIIRTLHSLRPSMPSPAISVSPRDVAVWL